jgi:hypothetical protein
MKKSIFLILLILLNSRIVISQMSVKADGSPPDNSAMLDVQSTDKGVVIPRMTHAQRDAIQDPIEGLMVYCTNCSGDTAGVLTIYENGQWYQFLMNCLKPGRPAAGSHVSYETQIIWNWNTLPISLGYKWNTTNDFNTATDMGTATTYTETGLTCNTSYTRYVWAYNDCGPSSSYRILTKETRPCP